ncbi:PRC-barrel domain-containing protein [Candidatus Bathyarchaeota archaeon]|nr:PRC-barrel domain-containing protein [Candidatus Bathyarchaeota archaeon]
MAKYFLCLSLGKTKSLTSSKHSYRIMGIDETIKAEKSFIKRGDLLGKQVIENRGLIIGNVRDVAFSFSEDKIELALTVQVGSQEINIPWHEVQAVGDVILLKVSRDKVRPSAVPAPTPVPGPTPTPPPPSTTLPPIVIERSCPECGHRNPPNAKYCVKCGKKLP